MPEEIRAFGLNFVSERPRYDRMLLMGDCFGREYSNLSLPKGQAGSAVIFLCFSPVITSSYIFSPVIHSVSQSVNKQVKSEETRSSERTSKPTLVLAPADYECSSSRIFIRAFQFIFSEEHLTWVYIFTRQNMRI